MTAITFCDAAQQPRGNRGLGPQSIGYSEQAYERAQESLRAGADRDRARRGARHRQPRAGPGDASARRGIHQAREDDHRAGDLPHGGARHRQDGRPQARRPDRHQGADLLRGGDDARARRGPGRVERAPAGRGHEHPARVARCGGGRRLQERGARAGRQRFRAKDHPGHRGRCIHGRRALAGPVRRAAVRPRPDRARTARPPRAAPVRGAERGRVRRRRDHHARRAHRRVRGDGVRNRQVRHAKPGEARLSHARGVPDLRGVRVRRARRDRARRRLLALAFPGLHQG